MSSIFKKYESYLADFKDYRKGTIRNLAYSTNNQNNTAVLIKGGLFCGKDKTQSTIIPDNTQFALGRDPFVMFACFKSLDDLGVHHIYSVYGTSALPRLVFRKYSANTNNINLVDSAGNSVFSSSITVANNEKICITMVVVPASNAAYVYKNGIYNHTINIATLVGNFSITSGNTIGPGVGRAADMNDVLYYCGVYKNLNLTATEVLQLYTELEVMPESSPFSKAIADGAGNNEVYFKGEMGALANESTIAVNNFVENTDIFVITTNCLFNAEKNNNKLEKYITNTGGNVLTRPNKNIYSTYHFTYYYAGIGVIYLIPSSRDNTINSAGQIGYRVATDGSIGLRISGSVVATAAAGSFPTGRYCDILITISATNIILKIDNVEIINHAYAVAITGDRMILNQGIQDKLIWASEDSKRSLYQIA